ncbi:MAG: hypothetical protein RDV41_01760, partial [Planctomycetota bacterium]|nr:hypothetical protein [Planctomycetota bacterium]
MIEQNRRPRSAPQKKRSTFALSLLLGCFLVVVAGIVAIALLSDADARTVEVSFNSRKITVDDILDWARVCDNLTTLRPVGEFDFQAMTLQAFASEMRARMPEMEPWCEVVGVTLESFILASDAIAHTTTLDEVMAAAGIELEEEEEEEEAGAEEPPVTPDRMWEVPDDMPQEIMDRLRAVYE